MKPGDGLTWPALLKRPAQLIINAMAIYAFYHCISQGGL